METKYGTLSNDMIIRNASDLINQIFKLLPYKENNDERLVSHFDSLLFRISGMAKIFDKYPEWVTIISLLEAARTEENFKLYRKAILDCCSIVKQIQEQAGDIHA